VLTSRPPIAVCFGGGGAFGLGYNMGVAAGLSERGFDLRRMPLLGTSAGAHTAAAIDNGLAFEHVAGLWEQAVSGASRRRRSSGIDLSGPIYVTRGDTDVGAVAVRLLTWRRHVLSADDHPLAEIVAASSSVPLLVRPHKIDGKRYVDGGAISMASIDLAPAADLLIAVTPFAVKQLGLAGRIGAFQARRESHKWSQRHGAPVLDVVPSPEMAEAGGQRVRDIADIRIARAVHADAIELGRHVGDIVRRDHPEIAARVTARDGQDSFTGGR